ncbi:prolipoprotein diacylglyceryl transferase family protein [Klenkia sp. PcliD-1-E]|uniref:prolipoprotein diacylglyceryl transferase family protein n=1 Tax=Klenkia sp. PcliD-1-E TaxID=2954492 RepID=UPI002097CB3C|nr:prolipoprotein diacylglyceryl transferase family protein [Klenkia sp. PcliD-1-E]MCO7220415.1 prolipoprotein diacylglyceryl transferase [Klenkia sp. PcliD-1-E]
MVEVPRSPALQKAPTAAVQVVTASCDAVPADAPHALGVNYWFQAASHGAPYTVRLRVVGRRRDAGFGDPASSFDVVRTVTDVVPGSGPVAVTLRVVDVAPGQWDVWVVPEEDDRPGAPAQDLAAGSASGASGFSPLVRVQGPGVRVAAWPTLVVLAAALGVTVQSALAGAVGLPRGRLLAVALLACLIGLAGAKTYYLLTHPASGRAGGGRDGMSVQGFIIASITTLVLGAAAWSMPVGSVLGVTAPALLAGLAVGRLGCFFGGCCAGRPTASRWGVWSSDRRIGVRRVPTQLLEATSAAVLVVPAALIVSANPATGLQVFVGFLAAYILGRQLLFPWRSIPRATRHGRTLTMVASGAALVAAAGSLLAGVPW